MSEQHLDRAKRLVIKIGSSLLIDKHHSAVRQSWLNTVVSDIAKLRADGKDVIVVSSGAVGLGRTSLNLSHKTLKLEEKQAAAAVGQIRLASAWQEALTNHQIPVAQILLTLEDSDSRRRYLNARNTMSTLLRLGAVPVINENDTVATTELRVGDNDRLAARVAVMMSADVLILMSDVEGLYSADPHNNPDAQLIGNVAQLTPEIIALAGGTDSKGYGTGGMITKLAAAKIAMDGGVQMAIISGKRPHPLQYIIDGGACTWFDGGASLRQARKLWIGGTLQASGAITIDNGAARALKSGKSLLPAGVIGVVGDFQRGDAVLVQDKDGVELARGLIAYSAKDAKLIMGRKSTDIYQILGYRGRDEMIHRDDLVVPEQVKTK